jgi:transcription initiation factor TFIID TATA-box-binding protein
MLRICIWLSSSLIWGAFITLARRIFVLNIGKSLLFCRFFEHSTEKSKVKNMELKNLELSRPTQSWIKERAKDSQIKVELVPVFDASIKIQNVVASVTLNQKFDLNAIVNGNPFVKYNPEQFPGLVFRLKKPKTAILIFSTGKMVCTGARSEKEAFRAVKNVIKKLKESGIIIPGKPEIKIVNMVASANLMGKIELEETACFLSKAMYEPEQFPGLIYRVDAQKVVILLFATGKLVCTGATKEEDIHEAVENLRQQLEKNDLIYH